MLLHCFTASLLHCFIASLADKAYPRPAYYKASILYQFPPQRPSFVAREYLFLAPLLSPWGQGAPIILWPEYCLILPRACTCSPHRFIKCAQIFMKQGVTCSPDIPLYEMVPCPQTLERFWGAMTKKLEFPIGNHHKSLPGTLMFCAMDLKPLLFCSPSDAS